MLCNRQRPWWRGLAATTLSLGCLVAQTSTVHAPETDLPANGSGAFQDLTVNGAKYAPNWAPWTWSVKQVGLVGGQVKTLSGAGIAIEGSGLLGASDPTSADDPRMAFLQGTGTATVQHTFQPGKYRVRFQAAQRHASGRPDIQRLQVTIGGTVVFEATPRNTRFEVFATAPVEFAAATTADIVFRGLVPGGDEVVLLDDVMLQPVLDWDDASTWVGGNVPDNAMTDVVITAGAAVAMSGSRVAKTVTVYGQLFADAADGTLDADYVLVNGVGSSFEVGTELHPFEHEFTLTLRAGASHEDAGQKFLMSMDGGQIDMHGSPRVSWTKLEAVNGDDITVVDPVDWQDDDEILVTRSKFISRDEEVIMPQSEAVTILKMKSDRVMQLKRPAPSVMPLSHPHHAGAPTEYTRPGDGRTWWLDERAEVGLLTHNVRIEGDQQSSATEQGAHVMFMKEHCCTTAGRGRISNVQMRRMGQKQQLGKYPVHWHMVVDEGQGQYLRSSSICESYNRAITVHGSNYVEVEDNVCFNVMGHAVFLEDGVERFNKFRRNLICWTRRPDPGDEMLEHDLSHNGADDDEPQNRSPAAFWISHPNNEFVGNVAVEGEGTGYWFALHREPTGASKALGLFDDIDATKAPLGRFVDNVAHSMKSGIDLNDSVDNNDTPDEPIDDTLQKNVAWDPPGGATLTGFVAYGCATGLYSGTGLDTVTFTDCVLADNEWHVQFASGFTLEQSLLVEMSGSGIFMPNHPSFSGSAYVVYDGPGKLRHCHLSGFFGGAGNPTTLISSVVGAALRHTNHEVEGLTFEGETTPQIRFKDFAAAALAPDPTDLTEPHDKDPRRWGIAVRDLDGTMTGVFDSTLITNHPFMHIGGPNSPDLPVANGEYAWISPFRWGHLVMAHFTASGNQLLKLDQPAIEFTRLPFAGYPSASFDYTFKVDGYRQIPIIADPAGAAPVFSIVQARWTPPSFARSTRLRLDDLQVGDAVNLKLTRDDGWGTPTVESGGVTLTAQSSPLALPGLPTTGYALIGNDLWLRIVHVGGNTDVDISW